MESKRSYARRKLYYRLLSFFAGFFFLGIVAYGQDDTVFEFSQKNDFAVERDSSFTLSLLDISPSDIEIERMNFQDGVEFVSSEKTDGFIREDDGGTRKATIITYTVRFLRAGTYDLGFLPVRINNREQRIDFPFVRVFENPGVILPELYLEHDTAYYSLHKGEFVVLAKYFKSVEDISIDLSEKALIELEDYSIEIPSSDFGFSEDSIELARFSCIPFESGTLVLPDISVTFVSYDNQRRIVFLNNKTLDVLAQQDYVEQSFGEERELQSSVYQNTIDEQRAVVQSLERKEDLAQTLANLRIKEKYAFFPFEATRERRTIEKSENIQNAGERSVTWTVIGLFFAGLLLFFSLILYIASKKKTEVWVKKYFYLCIVLGALLLVATSIYGYPLLKEEAITCGTQMYAIPEYESHIVTSVYAGNKVEIMRSIGEWYLVLQPDGRTGWILQSDCIRIAK